MPRTLKAIAGERPRCQFCDKPLRPDTSTVELAGHLQEAPWDRDCEGGTWNPDKEWKVDTIEYVAGVMGDFGLEPAKRRPNEARDHDRL